MEKHKRWHFWLIMAVMAVTLYNIVPTIIFYARPLKEPVTEQVAMEVAREMAARVNGLEKDATTWLGSLCELLHVKPKAIQLSQGDASLVWVDFDNEQDARLFRQYLPRAGVEVPFVPAQLGLASDEESTRVTVLRRVGFHFDEAAIGQLFEYAPKYVNGKVSDFYYNVVANRFADLATAAEESPLGRQVEMAVAEGDHSQELVELSREVGSFAAAFGSEPIADRYLRAVASTEQIKALKGKIDDECNKLETQVSALREEQRTEEAAGNFLAGEKVERLEQMAADKRSLEQCKRLLRGSSRMPMDRDTVLSALQRQRQADPSQAAVIQVALENPFIAAMGIDWANDRLFVRLHGDVQGVTGVQQEVLKRALLNEMARISQVTGEQLLAQADGFRVDLCHLQGSQSLLALHLPVVGEQSAKQLLGLVSSEWAPSHADLALPCVDDAGYKALPASDQKYCVWVTAPKESVEGLRSGSVYIIARGLKSVVEGYQKYESDEAKHFHEEFGKLSSLLQARGCIRYDGGTASPSLERDIVFELNDYAAVLLAATREELHTVAGGELALLEFTDREQRLLTTNRIEDAVQEDLVRWKEAYQAAQVDSNPMRHYTVPKPTRSAFWSNYLLSAKKYFRGDSNRILRWGLDLSGGKSVRIALIDHAGKAVTDQQQLTQAVNELYTRLNSMGVAERTIRIENDTVLVDFPGSQAYSASELIKASAMYFHVVNEQFGYGNKALAKPVHDFLQEVWNEAVITNRKDIASINEIAYQKLEAAARFDGHPLLQHGLKLADPNGSAATVSFDTALSMVARVRGESMMEWNDSHPLLFVFHNYALEGSSLDQIQTAYDPSKGNALTFNVKGSAADDLYNWTSQFSEESISGTPRAAVAPRGWRMAVVLNNSVVSSPSLTSPLRDRAMISGSFSHREVSKLATDLNAGSLSFMPRILSEQNVSPELGQQERTQSIIAACVAVVAVVATMCGYYRFAGLVASCAVMLNVLVIWAVMQNIDAVLTLPGIAGMVLTVGMAVDANVLVFERIREEFSATGRIATAIQAGYQKAFSAILDSNVTTILVALILLQFDCGPIRGFAMTLIIGIAASMFTALFMTRTFFSWWVQNPKHQTLTMANWIRPGKIDFLRWVRPAVVASVIVVMVGAGVFALNWRSMVGMDFTGGYSLVVELEQDGRELASEALLAKGLMPQEFQIRELGRPNLLRIQLGIGLEQPGGPFYQMPKELDSGVGYERNPRITWIVDVLQGSGLKVKAAQLPTLASNWTAMSGQFSDTMRNNALAALALALVGVLIYIAMRFEWKYAVSSVLALVHDVALTLSVAAIAFACGLPVQINLEMIGALMMIIGYSLNDTIIVFDRIREDVRLYKKLTLPQVINKALNATLSRTLLTSGTTLLVLVALLLLGGKSIFGFAFVMAVGIFLGTLSSLYIASPILLWLHNREEAAGRLPARATS